MGFSQASQKKETRKERKARIDAHTKKLQKEAEEGAIIFNKQSTFHITLRSDGYGIGYEHGKFKTATKTNLWWFNLAERKHPKEEKLVVSYANGEQAGNPYIFGKINNFYLFNLGFGQQKLLGGKSSKNGIAISAIYGGGLSIGMLKPYYLEVDDSAGGKELIKYQTNNDPRFLDAQTSIYGAAPFGKGFGEIKFVPGIFAKGALRFEYGRFNDIVSALEIGISAEYYTQKMPILLLQKDKSFFLNGHISLIFGSRR